VWLAAALGTLLYAAPCFSADRSKPTEYAVKAVYLYNFGKFVSWPSKAGGSNRAFGICVLGDDPFGHDLDSTVDGETIDGQAVVVKRFASVQNAPGCDILYISVSEDKRLKQILSDLNKLPILTVSDMTKFVERGGMMQFVLEGDRVRFEVNLSSAQKVGLNLSSELLKVAVKVKKGPGTGD
jgi:YfiR/HmsC-like